MFDLSATAYDALIGRYSPRLAVASADAARVTVGMRALDVGCGPGALTGELVRRLGTDHVSAIDPSSRFEAECRRRSHPLHLVRP